MGLTKEESNFLRFYYLNLTVATKAVRVYFDSVHPPVVLAGELGIISANLKRLRFITKQQIQTLYPSSGKLIQVFVKGKINQMWHIDYETEVLLLPSLFIVVRHKQPQ